MVIAQARLPPLRSGELMRAIAHLTAITATASLLTLTAPPATTAQLIPDTTLGSENSQVTPGTLIHGLPADLIEGGAPRGSNLFHSFQEFNVGDLQRVYFDNPAGITNIFSRVTGGNPSQILGTLGVAGSANLFFLNPNGLLFGPKAQLDIAGSFFASTADRWLFDNGLEFSATNPAAPSPLLTISITPGLQSGTAHHAGISSQGNLVTGGDLTLHGGWLDLQGTLQAGGALTLHATDTLRLRDTATIPFIAAARGNLLVQGNNQVDIFTLNHPDSGFYAGGDLVLRSSNAVGGDAHFWSGGNFRVEQLDGSSGDLFSPHDPIIIAKGGVIISGYTGASLHILAGGGIRIDGGVNINGPDLSDYTIHPGHIDPIIRNLAAVTLSDGTPLTIDGRNQATLDLRAGIDDNFIETLIANAVNPTLAQGVNGNPLPSGGGFEPKPSPSSFIQINGNINVLQPNGLVFITNQYQPDIGQPGEPISIGSSISTVSVTGNSGNVIIDSRQNLEILSGSQIITASLANESGTIRLLSQGDINAEGTEISSDSSAANSNLIELIANRDLNFSGRISSSSELGNGGGINLQAQRNLNLSNAELKSTTGDSNGNGSGDGGQIQLTAAQNLHLEGTLLTSSSGGDAGNIQASSQGNMTLRGSIEASSTRGSAGNIDLRARQNLATTATIEASTDSGRAGNLSLVSQLGSIQVSGGELVSETFGNGQAGSIRTTAANHFVLSNGAELSARTRGSGSAGNIAVTASGIQILDRGRIFANTVGTGSGGNIALNASEQITLNRGFIFANTFRLPTSPGVPLGNAGNISLTSPQVSIENGSLISAFSQSEGNGGSISVETGNGNLSVSGVDQFGVPSGIFMGATSNGNAGNLTVNTGNLVISDRGLIFANTSGSGQAGDIRINTYNLTLSNSGRISAATTGVGNAGVLSVEAIGTVNLDGVGTGLNLQSTGSGNAGGVRIVAGDNLNITNGAQITVQGTGSGNPGNIEIRSRSLYLENQGSITALTTSGEDANINIEVKDSIILRHNSEIVAEALGTGNGGNMRLIAGNLIFAFLSENSDIVANAYEGRGGNIYARALLIFGFRQFNKIRTPESDFIASSELGIDGAVTFDTARFQPDVSLPDQFRELGLSIGCHVNHQTESQSARGEFYIVGSGGLPTNPEEASFSRVQTPWTTASSDFAEPVATGVELDNDSATSESVIWGCGL